MLDGRDAALQTLTPSVMVPKFGQLNNMDEAGHRFLLGHDGLWMEVKRPWLELCVPLAQQSIVPMPYGQVSKKMQFKFGKLPQVYLWAFLQEARNHLPNECAAWFIWNETDNTMRMEMLVANFASSGSINYQCPVLEEGEHFVADIHSHGTAHAFFSSQDNEDDKTEVKIAAVLGNVDRAVPTMQARLCANGYFIDLPAYDFARTGS